MLLEDFPSGGAHEALWWLDVISSVLAHLRSRDEFEGLGIGVRGAEEFHLVGLLVKGSHFEGVDLNSTEESLGVHKELLSVPSVVEVGTLLSGVTNTSGVSSGNEVSDTTSNSGGGVP